MTTNLHPSSYGFSEKLIYRREDFFMFVSFGPLGVLNSQLTLILWPENCF